MRTASVSGPQNGLESSVPVKILTFGAPERFFIFWGARNGVPVRSVLLLTLDHPQTKNGLSTLSFPEHRLLFSYRFTTDIIALNEMSARRVMNADRPFSHWITNTDRWRPGSVTA